jgi:hypothetical protein
MRANAALGFFAIASFFISGLSSSVVQWISSAAPDRQGATTENTGSI